MDQTASLSEEFEWFFVDKFEDNKAKGPVSERDLDVMWQTRLIDSQTLVWKNGMPSWMTINNVEDLKNSIAAANALGMFSNVTKKSEGQQAPKQQTKMSAQNLETISHLPSFSDMNAMVDKMKKSTELKPEILAGRSTQEINHLQQIHKLANELDDENEEDEDDSEEEEGVAESLEQRVEKMKKKIDKGIDEEDILVEEDMIEDLLKNLGQEELKEYENSKKEGKGNNIFGDNNLDKRRTHFPVQNKAAEIDYSKLTPEEIKKIEKRKKKAKKQQEKKKKKWYNPRVNTNIYINGLPPDITQEEVVEFFGKAGVFRTDPVTGEERIRIYKDDDGNIKGDALISYVKEESVDLAMELLNERDIKPGFKIMIEPAHFEQKGEYVPRKQIKIDNVTKIRIEAEKNKRLGWDEEEQGEGLKIIVIKNMFSLEETQEDPNFVPELQQDITAECEEKLGPISRVEVFMNNPNGIVMIRFKEAAGAEGCIKLMNGRYFAGRQLLCHYWDGKTDYRRVRESAEDEQKRIDEFGQWLEGQMGSKEGGENASSAPTEDSNA